MKKKNLSKFLSLILRHKPEELGIKLDREGWASVEEILEKMQARGMQVNLSMIQEVVRENNKQRFKLSQDCTQIRANQGHSIKVDLGFTPIKPPEQLFHGTALRNKESILEKGILKGSRQFVHLSAEKETALNVGKRHGKPILLKINTDQMAKDGIPFYRSENGVWLTEHVLPKYIESF